MARGKSVVVETPNIVCCRCGNATQSNFYQSKDVHRKVFCKVLYCKKCIKDIYDYYLNKYKTMNLAIYYTCRKIDVPYNHVCYKGAVENINNEKSTIYGDDNIVKAYMKNMGSFSEQNGWGSCFDDTQDESDIDGLSSFADMIKVKRKAALIKNTVDTSKYDVIEYDTEELIDKWGLFEADDLSWLESEYLDWENKLGGITDKTTEMMVKEVCKQYREVIREREKDGGDADKKIKVLNSLLKEAGLAGSSAASSDNSIGMGIKEIEFRKPIKEPDKDLNDVDKVNDILIGFIGTMSRVLGKNNVYTEEFDKRYSKYTIDKISELERERIAQNAVKKDGEKIGGEKQDSGETS